MKLKGRSTIPLWIYYGITVFPVVFMLVSQSETNEDALNLMKKGAIFLIILAVSFGLNWLTAWSASALSKIPIKRWFQSMALATEKTPLSQVAWWKDWRFYRALVILIVGINGLAYATEQIFLMCGYTPNTQDVATGLMALTKEPWMICVAVGGICVAIPIIEELLYRGITACAWGIWVTAFLFALAHGSVVLLVPFFVFSLGLSWMVRRWGGLWPAIVVHMVFNGLSTTMLMLYGMN